MVIVTGMSSAIGNLKAHNDLFYVWIEGQNIMRSELTRPFLRKFCKNASMLALSKMRGEYCSTKTDAMNPKLSTITTTGSLNQHQY